MNPCFLLSRKTFDMRKPPKNIIIKRLLVSTEYPLLIHRYLWAIHGWSIDIYGLYLDKPRVSTNFPILLFFVGELLTKVEGELIRRIAIKFCCASVTSSWVPVLLFIPCTPKLWALFVGRRNRRRQQRKQHRGLFCFFAGRESPIFDVCLKHISIFCRLF